MFSIDLRGLVKFIIVILVLLVISIPFALWKIWELI